MNYIQQIQKKLERHKKGLFERYRLKSMAIFGSYGREEQHDGSDLDILVEFSEPIGIQFVDLADELESILELKVDLVSRKGVKEKYLKAITPDLIYV